MPTTKNSNNKIHIVRFKEYYPILNRLTRAQRLCYQAIVERIQQGVYVDLGDNISYILLFVGLKLDEASAQGKSSIDRVISDLTRLNDLYAGNMIISSRLGLWIGDLYYLKEDFLSALKMYESSLPNGKESWYGAANNILNLKYMLKS